MVGGRLGRSPTDLLSILHGLHDKDMVGGASSKSFGSLADTNTRLRSGGGVRMIELELTGRK